MTHDIIDNHEKLVDHIGGAGIAGLGFGDVDYLTRRKGQVDERSRATES